MIKLLVKLRKEFLGVVAVTIAIVFFSVKRSAYADTAEHIETFTQVYDTISQQVEPLSEVTVAGDELMNGKISERREALQKTKEQLTHGELSDTISHLEANLAVLQNDIASARALLPQEATQESYFNHASLDLLDAYTYRHSDKTEDALVAIQRAVSSYSKALQTSLGDINPDQLHKSYLQAQQLYYIIAITHILDTHKQLFSLSQVTKVTHEHVVQVISSAKSNLLKRQFGTDTGLNACKQDLVDALNEHQRVLADLPASYDQLYTRLEGAIRLCLEAPLVCVQDLSVWNKSMMQGREQLNQLLESWLLSYQRLETIIARRDTGALRALCESTQNSDPADTMEQLMNGLEDTLGDAGKSQQKDEGDQNAIDLQADEWKNGLPAEWNSELLDEIDVRSQERLQKTSDLERDPAYSPEDHLQNLFEEFRGDKTGF